MKNTDVLIIGGSAAGMVAAVTGKAHWPDKEFILVKKQKDMMVPCGIPYIFGTLESTDKNLMPVDAMMEKNGISSLVDEAVDINPDTKVVTFASGDKISYQKLVIATGSTPMKPKWLHGADLQNVFVIPKDRNYLDEMKTQLGSAKNIAVIGAGFIGVELSDELVKHGYNVTLIEKLPHILNLAFDPEIAEKVHEMIVARGVNVITGKGISKVTGTNKVEAIELEDGQTLPMDAVVLSIGYKPNTELAKKSGIQLDEDNFIAVDEYMRTHHTDVFAIGDCAQKRDFVTRRRVPTMLASTACAEARIAGMNLFDLQVVKSSGQMRKVYPVLLQCLKASTATLAICPMRTNRL
jgi:NADPH-dependent 2,4-dienoyl-CoA reductase/sulfur reductase-like enzyme